MDIIEANLPCEHSKHQVLQIGAATIWSHWHELEFETYIFERIERIFSDAGGAAVTDKHITNDNVKRKRSRPKAAAAGHCVRTRRGIRSTVSAVWRTLAMAPAPSDAPPSSAQRSHLFRICFAIIARRSRYQCGGNGCGRRLTHHENAPN